MMEKVKKEDEKLKKEHEEKENDELKKAKFHVGLVCAIACAIH